MRIQVSRGRQARLRFSRTDWRQLLRELERRGERRRESGAFLLGARGERSGRIRRVVYYDDLDPECLQGTIAFSGFGFAALWDICVDEGFDLIADVHTHPGLSVAQSVTDREHPMYARPGHIALIVPNFASKPVKAREVGVHEYLGDTGWRSHYKRDAGHLLYIGRRA
jgi:proteasome lid subunit RPN8/RPN11